MDLCEIYIDDIFRGIPRAPDQILGIGAYKHCSYHYFILISILCAIPSIQHTFDPSKVKIYL